MSIEILIEEPVKGPGISKINCNLLNDPVVAKQIGTEIEIMMRQVGNDWNPHLILEFLKMSIRMIFASKAAEQKKGKINTITEIEEELNQIEELKIRLLKNDNIISDDKQQRQTILEKAITTLKSSLHELRTRLYEKTTFAASAKWFELGEKPNKYFLNLNKVRQGQKLISQIKDGNEEYIGQSQIAYGIKKFYQNLYAKQETELPKDSTFYDNCPKLTEEQSKNHGQRVTN